MKTFEWVSTCPKKGSLKKSIEHQIHLEKINYPRQISSSHADFDKKKSMKNSKMH